MSNVVTSNLSDSELMIRSLEVKDCPLKQICVKAFGNNVSTICNHLEANPMNDADGNLNLGQLYCQKDEKMHEVKVLLPDCVEIINVVIPHEPNPQKSHAHIVCED